MQTVLMQADTKFLLSSKGLRNHKELAEWEECYSVTGVNYSVALRLWTEGLLTAELARRRFGFVIREKIKLVLRMGGSRWLDESKVVSKEMEREKNDGELVG